MNLAERLGYAPDARVLILNADDVGSTHASNAAAFECLEHGSLTSASVLVPAPWFPEVTAFAREHPQVNLGIHLTLTCEHTPYRWRPITERSVAPGLYDDEGYLWRTRAEAVEHVSVEEAEREMRAQIETALAGGIDVTHLDTHWGTAIQPKFIETFVSLGLEYKIPLFSFRPNADRLRRIGLGPLWDGLELQLRRLDAAGFPVVDNIYTEEPNPPPEKKEAFFKEFFANLRPGVTHFLVHPAARSDEVDAMTVTGPDRAKDHELFRDRSMADELARLGIETISYREIREAHRAGTLRS